MNNFDERVYGAVRKIPKGKVSTYKLIAKRLRSKAYRAVGQALRRNPYSAWGWAKGKSCQRQKDIVPCHRVVRNDGSIGGFCGSNSGKEVKRKIVLLKKEGVIVRNGKIVDFKRKKI